MIMNLYKHPCHGVQVSARAGAMSAGCRRPMAERASVASNRNRHAGSTSHTTVPRNEVLQKDLDEHEDLVRRKQTSHRVRTRLGTCDVEI